MSAGTVILLQMRRIVRRFREAGATNAGAAIVPSQYDIRQSFAFERLVKYGVLVAVDHERFYMDEEAEAKFRKQKRFIVFVILTLVILGIIISLLVSK
jgi:hypothetical protein